MAGKQAFLNPGLTTHSADDCAWIWKKDRSSRENEGDVGKTRAGPRMLMEKSVKPWENETHLWRLAGKWAGRGS